MAFKGIQITETDAEETARLARAPEGSINHALSQLPITNPYPTTTQVLELPGTKSGKCSGTAGGLSHECDGTHRIVVIPIRQVGKATNAAGGHQLPVQHTGHWACRVLASDHPSYPVGGHDLSLCESELRRPKVVEL